MAIFFVFLQNSEEKVISPCSMYMYVLLCSISFYMLARDTCSNTDILIVTEYSCLSLIKLFEPD